MNAWIASLLLLTPPSDWEIASDPSLSPRIEVAFVKKNTSRFRPSLNLTTEKVNLSLDEYVGAVRKLYSTEHHTRWRYLGSYATAAGPAALTELDVDTEWGPVRMLQLLLVKEGTAYIVTGATLKEESFQYYQTFRAIFKEIAFTEDLFTAIPGSDKRALLQTAWQKLLEDRTSEWKPFVKMIENEYAYMGSHWQWLVFKTLQKDLQPLEK